MNIEDYTDEELKEMGYFCRECDLNPCYCDYLEEISFEELLNSIISVFNELLSDEEFIDLFPQIIGPVNRLNRKDEENE